MTRSRLIASLFALTLFVSGAPFVHAQSSSGTSDFTLPSDYQQTVSGAAAQQQINQDAQAAEASNNAAIQQDGATDATQQQQQIQSSAPAGLPANTAAASSPTNSTTDNTPGGIMDYIMAKLMTLFAWLLGIAAITLDNAMYYTVVHMGAYINGLSAVGVAWRILRDIGNIVLIFGFLALGITVILDVDWYGGGTKMLPTLLIAAVFLNFSLFIAEAVVDVGNLFATEFYTQINGGTAAAPQSYTGQAISNEGISSAVMNQLGLQTIYGGAVGASNGQNINTLFKEGNTFIVGFMAIILFMIAAFVFFSLAFILIARFIFLIFLIIIAPIGIAGIAVPKLGKLASDWWSSLFAQTMTAPVMLLMLYVALAVITDANFLTGFGSSSNGAAGAWTNFLGGGAGLGSVASIMLSFLVAMGLLLAVTMLAKKMGAVGGQWATSMGGKLSFGAVGFVGRRTVGRGANALSRTIRSSRFGRSDLGRLATFATDKAAKGSFDIRGTSLLKTAGVDAGTAYKGSYNKLEESSVKDRTEYAKHLELTSKEKAEQAALQAELNKAKVDRDKAIKDAGDYKPAQDEAKKIYAATEERIQNGEKDSDGNKIKRGLKDFNGLPQTQYADNLEKASSLRKIGTYVNAGGLGGVAGTAGAIAAGATGAGVGAGLGFGAYLASAGPRANKVAADKIKKAAKKGEGKKLAEAFEKALNDAEKGAGGGEKEEKKEDAH